MGWLGAFQLQPSSKQMVPPPTHKKAEPKKAPPVVPAKLESTDGDQPGGWDSV